MSDDAVQLLTIVAAVGAGLNAGVFFAFSTFVMSGLGLVDDRAGMTAMQGINQRAPTPVFMFALFGTALVCVVLGVVAATRLDEPAAPYQLAGSVLYLVCIVMTGAYHVPRNNALDRTDVDRAGAPELWRRYLAEWTTGNHVRTLSTLAAAVAFVLAVAID
jgi:uncharacterized membrane protein